MDFSEEFESKRKYSRISMKKRQNLVNMVLGNDQTIACAARRLGLKPSTARMILNKFKKTGTYPIKNFKKPIRQECLFSPPVKQEAVESDFLICQGDNQQRQVERREEAEEEILMPQIVDPYYQVLMVANAVQTLYFPFSLSFP